jgi:AcrR family transcriptional regulator
MSPRRSVLDAGHTRATILARAREIASVDGLEGVTIGRLADTLAMSKSGVLGHFGTKQSLQLAAVQSVIDDFRVRVVEPALSAAPGIPRVLALCDNWFDYLAGTGLPGGCLLTAAATEFDSRTGEVHDLVRDSWAMWRDLLRTQLARCSVDVEQALFELVALGPAANLAIQLHHDFSAPDRAKRAARRVLGQADPM